MASGPVKGVTEFRRSHYGRHNESS